MDVFLYLENIIISAKKMMMYIIKKHQIRFHEANEFAGSVDREGEMKGVPRGSPSVISMTRPYRRFALQRISIKC